MAARHIDGAYSVLLFSANCAASRGELRVTYDFLFDLDPTHRGLLRVDAAGESHQAVLDPINATFELGLQADHSGAWRTFLDYWRLGLSHIWHGFDHLLFLFSLLLPAVMTYQAGSWKPRTSLKATAIDVAWVVTAFTIAHSITLGLAVLGNLHLPGRMVESTIALTVVLAALNNVFPLVAVRRWVLAFVLGLVHGLGFAGAIAGLNLGAENLLLSLAAFNLGVESGQLFLAALFLPVAFWCRHLAIYRHGLLRFGSCLIALIGVFWLVERSLNLSLVPLFTVALP